jgi:hypothetical protein
MPAGLLCKPQAGRHQSNTHQRIAGLTERLDFSRKGMGWGSAPHRHCPHRWDDGYKFVALAT